MSGSAAQVVGDSVSAQLSWAQASLEVGLEYGPLVRACQVRPPDHRTKPQVREPLGSRAAIGAGPAFQKYPRHTPVEGVGPNRWRETSLLSSLELKGDGPAVDRLLVEDVPGKAGSALSSINRQLERHPSS